MTLGGRSGLSVLLTATLALTAAICAIWLYPGFTRAGHCAPGIILLLLIFARLRAAAYAPAVAATICACLAFLPDSIAMLTRFEGPVWLALAMFALAASGADAVARTGVRSIIGLGISLALLLTIDPIGAVLVALIVPLLLSQPRLRANGFQAVTLAMLVLFIPIITSVLLLQIGGAPAFTSILTAFGLHPTAAATSSPFALTSSIALLVPATTVPMVQRQAGSPAAIFAAMLGLAVIAAFAFTVFIGLPRETGWLSACLLPVTAVLIAALKPHPMRNRMAIAASLLSLAAAWIAGSV